LLEKNLKAFVGRKVGNGGGTGRIQNAYIMWVSCGNRRVEETHRTRSSEAHVSFRKDPSLRNRQKGPDRSTKHRNTKPIGVQVENWADLNHQP
jgi:hypothetical protein